MILAHGNRLRWLESDAQLVALRWHRCYRCQTHYRKSFKWNQYHGRDLFAIPQIWHLCPNRNFDFYRPLLLFSFFKYNFPASMSNHHILLSLSKHTTDRSQNVWLLLSGMHSNATQYNYPAIRNACAIHINVLHCCAHHFTQTTKTERKKLEATTRRRTDLRIKITKYADDSHPSYFHLCHCSPFSFPLQSVIASD